jgi:regulator of replication initiation timing
MSVNNYGLQAEAQVDKDFVEELIYENISLWEENIMLYFENMRLRKELQELKRLERWWGGEGVSKRVN